MAIAAKSVSARIIVDHEFAPGTNLAALTASVEAAIPAALDAIAAAYTTASLTPDGVDVTATIGGGAYTVPDPPT